MTITDFANAKNRLLGIQRKDALHTAAILLWVLFISYSGTLQAAPVDPNDACNAATAWLAKDAGIFGGRLGHQISSVKTFTDEENQPVYHVVYLKPDGYVIISAEDGVEPVIGFVSEGDYDPSQSNPLGALVSRDLPTRVRAIRTLQKKRIGGQPEKYLTGHDAVIRKAEKKAVEKWKTLLTKVSSRPELKTSLGSISDIRVSPLLQSNWGQYTASGNACYNYYTPPDGNGSTDNYPCGCVALAMAQYMRFRQYPTAGVGNDCFLIRVDESTRTRCLRGGDGSGGPYNWSQMTLVPNSSTTLAQRQAIGALTYDAGVAIGTHYASDSSGAYMSDATEALRDTFGYSNAIYGYNNTLSLGNTVNVMVNPNLDYGNPVLLSVHGDGGHAIIVDGYGYSNATLYHHLNMGWYGSDDVWYNLPNIDSSPSFDIIDGAIYNIYTSGSGEIISGRVMDGASPISGVTVTATKTSGGTYQAITNINGIYAIAKVPSKSNYTVSAFKSGYSFENRVVSTGLSQQAVTGNQWGVAFSNVGHQVQISRCTVTAGNGDNNDKISFSGRMNASSDYLSAAGTIDVTVNSAELVTPFIQNFPINSTTFKNGVYNYTLIGSPSRSVFKFNTKNQTFSFSAQYADLRGLSCPVMITVEIGSYSTEIALDETIVNGAMKSCPLPLMMGVEDSLTCRFKPTLRTAPTPDSFTAQGTFTLAGTYDKANPLVITLGDQTFTVPGNLFIAKGYQESCMKAISAEGSIVDVKLDFAKCTYTISVKNTSITQSGTVNFGVCFFGYCPPTVPVGI